MKPAATVTPATTVTVDDFTLNTTIQRLGKAAIQSPMPEASFIESESTPLFLDSEHLEELNGKPPIAVSFESAGPRREIYFDPSKTK